MNKNDAKEKKLKITQVKSEIGFSRKQRIILRGLGLTKRGKTVIRKDTPEIRGMIQKVIHLINIEEI